MAKSTTSPLAPKNDEVLVKVDTSAAVSTTPASAKEKNAKKKEAEAKKKEMKKNFNEAHVDYGD